MTANPPKFIDVPPGEAWPGLFYLALGDAQGPTLLGEFLPGILLTSPSPNIASMARIINASFAVLNSLC